VISVSRYLNINLKRNVHLNYVLYKHEGLINYFDTRRNSVCLSSIHFQIFKKNSSASDNTI